MPAQQSGMVVERVVPYSLLHRSRQKISQATHVYQTSTLHLSLLPLAFLHFFTSIDGQYEITLHSSRACFLGSI
jgi:hypothetical protein